MKPAVTALVSMPWANLHMPSIQMGTLEAVLKAHDLPAYPFSMYVQFMEFLHQKTKLDDVPFTTKHYYTISDWSFLSGMGDWVFAGEPYHAASESDVEAYLLGLKPNLAADGAGFLLLARSHAAEFLELAANRVLASNPDIVGFTSTFSQNVPSLALAKVLKAKAPDVAIVFGGANCEGIMGEALIESFPYVDYVVRGEGEYVLPQLVRSIAKGQAPTEIPGLCFREAGNVRVNGFENAVQVAPADIPQPVYDEYFAVLERSAIRKDVDPHVRLPVESSRGCWWGEKHHCTFCGLNGLTMAFRSKPPAKFVQELVSLSNRYARTGFNATDNILDMRYFQTVIPELIGIREAGYDFDFFYETKANLRKEHIAMLASAGVKEIQPGIESLSTRILSLIDKGVTALQNIQLLKWAKEYGISVEWNLIYGFPGESDEDWDEVHALIPLLSHLQAPNITPLLLERFSPYFDRSEHYSVVNLGPKAWYQYLYPNSKISDMVYYFDYACAKTVSSECISRVHERLKQFWNAGQSETSTLTYVRGPGFVKVTDKRTGLEPREMILRGLTAEVFLQCDAISTTKKIAAELSREESEVSRVCERLADVKLLLFEAGRCLALPVATTPLAAVAPTTRLVQHDAHAKASIPVNQSSRLDGVASSA